MNQIGAGVVVSMLVAGELVQTEHLKNNTDCFLLNQVILRRESNNKPDKN